MFQRSTFGRALERTRQELESQIIYSNQRQSAYCDETDIGEKSARKTKKKEKLEKTIKLPRLKEALL